MVPFSLLDATDGFYNHKIGTPWAFRDETAHKLVQILLDAVMIRHSKSQTTLDGRSILELPPITHDLRAVEPTLSERAVLMYLEALGRALEGQEGLEAADAATAAAVAAAVANSGPPKVRQLRHHFGPFSRSVLN